MGSAAPHWLGEVQHPGFYNKVSERAKMEREGDRQRYRGQSNMCLGVCGGRTWTHGAVISTGREHEMQWNLATSCLEHE